MKKNKLIFLKMLTAAVLVSGLWGLGNLRAEEADEQVHLPVTQGWMQEALNKIENRLTAIEENQQKILEGQTRLSEEHTQLRYWVHRN